MKTDLRGTLRAALRLCAQNWRGLASACTLPFILAAIIGGIQLWQARDIYAAFMAASLTPAPDTEANLQALMQSHSLLFFGFSIFNMLIMAWQFTRVVQFWKSGVARSFSVMPGELHETAAIVVYALLLGVLLMLVYVCAVFVMALTVQVLSAAHLPDTGLAAAVNLASLAILLLLVAISMRFLVGFPGIAQGGTPRLVRDLWPLAKGFTFSLAWRSVAAGAAFFIFAFVMMLIFLVPLMAIMGSDIVNPATQSLGPDAGRALAAAAAPAVVFSQWLWAGFIAYFTTFLTLAFAKLSGQDLGMKK